MLGLGLTAAQTDDKRPLVLKYKSKKFIAFDGVNEYGEVSAGDTFMDAVGTTGGTIAFWVRSSDFYQTTNNAYSYMIGGYHFAFPNVKSFYIGTRNDGGNDRIIVYRADLNIMTSTFTRWSDFKSTSADHLTDDTWHHIALVLKPFSSSWKTTLYVDGAQVGLSQLIGAVNASNTASPAHSNLSMTMARYNTSYDPFDFNELAIWDSELTSSEIDFIYDQGMQGMDFTKESGDYASSADLYAWYKMGDDKDSSESNEPDSSGNDRDMTLYNAPDRSDH